MKWQIFRFVRTHIRECSCKLHLDISISSTCLSLSLPFTKSLLAYFHITLMFSCTQEQAISEANSWDETLDVSMLHLSRSHVDRQLGGPYQQPARNFVQLGSEQQEIKSIIYVIRRIKANSRSTASPQQPTVPTVVKKFPVFYDFWNFITVLTTASTCLCP